MLDKEQGCDCMWPYPKRTSFILLILFLCCSCQQSGQTYDTVSLTRESPSGFTKPLYFMNSGQDIVDYAYDSDSFANVRFSQLIVPDAMYPLGMIDSRYGYLVKKEKPDVLWLYDYQEGTMQEVIDYRSSSCLLGLEIVFNKEWLVWVEMTDYELKENGLRERLVSLKARDLINDHELLLDVSYSTPAEGFFIPFDCFDIEHNTLVYRKSSFYMGKRDTNIIRLELTLLQKQLLFTAKGADGQMITGCSIDDQLIVWDVQTVRSLKTHNLPIRQEARYSIFGYEIKEKGQIDDEVRPWSITVADDYFAPIVYKKQIIALRQLAISQKWLEISVSPYILYDQAQVYRNLIALIDPYQRIAKPLVWDIAFSQRIVKEYAAQNKPLYIERGNVFLGKSILSWQSNIVEQGIVFDFNSYKFLTLPLFFYLDNINDYKFWTRPINGLDADYIVFGLNVAAEPNYILRIE